MINLVLIILPFKFAYGKRQLREENLSRAIGRRFFRTKILDCQRWLRQLSSFRPGYERQTTKRNVHRLFIDLSSKFLTKKASRY